MTTDDDDLFNVLEAAKRLGVHADVLKRLTRGKQPGDQILVEIATIATLFVSDEADTDHIFDRDRFEAFLRVVGYGITKTERSVTFTILDA